MSTTPPEAPPAPEPGQHDAGPRTSREELRDLGRIRRTVGPERKVAGVAGGLARHLDVDPIILRVAFVVLVFFGGSGLLLYGACWLLLPEDGQARAPLSLDDRSRSVALVVVGAVSAVLLLGDSIGQFDFPWPLVLIAGAALLVLVLLDRDRTKPRPTAPPVPHQQDPVTHQFVPAPGYPVQPPPTQSQATLPQVTQPQTGPTQVMPTWAAPAYYPPRPRNPRRRGPVLFLFTVFTAAVLVAVLGVLDLAGVAVADPAYAAVVAATCGVMLLVAAFYGRGGGLILVGLLAAAAMGLSAVVGTTQGHDIRHTPTLAADVPDDLSIGAGEIVLDLTEVTDPAALDGQTLTQRVRAGRIEIIVPDEFGVRVDADVSGAGDIALFGADAGGIGVEDSATRVAAPGAPTITVDAELVVGEIEVQTQSERFGG